MSIVTYPTPVYQNLPIETQFYLPRLAEITAITQGMTTTFTTESNIFYKGQLVRFIIPPSCGIRELNGKEAYILEVLSDTQFIADINTEGFNAFTVSTSLQLPQVLPIGTYINGVANVENAQNVQTYPNGTFIKVF